MYIQSVEIQHIKGIEHFSMTFPKPAGWHVLIGDNGAGKTTILQAVAACLCGPYRFSNFRYGTQKMLKKDSDEGSVILEVSSDKYDYLPGQPLKIGIRFKKERDSSVSIESIDDKIKFLPWNGITSWFSASFGALRRLKGGNPENNKLFDSDHRAAAHISLFESEVAFIMVGEWLTRTYIQKLKKDNSEQELISNLMEFLNQGSLLPNGFRFDSIDETGMILRGPDGLTLPADAMSEGIRTVIAMTLELIRQMATIFFVKDKKPFFTKKDGRLVVEKSGVVLIDEVDAHLHPTWQTRIGQWFTTYFPNIQFIVTTHSPLICRAAEKGSIWRLAAPGSGEDSGEVTGTDRDRLIYGNVLDAYGTDVFGENVARSEGGMKLLEQYAHLEKLRLFGKLSDDQKIEWQKLQQIFTTDVTNIF